jgi:hypothetical protein
MSLSSSHTRPNDSEVLANPGGQTPVADEEKAVGGSQSSELGRDAERDPKDEETKDPNLVSNIQLLILGLLSPFVDNDTGHLEWLQRPSKPQELVLRQEMGGNCHCVPLLLDLSRLVVDDSASAACPGR